MIYNNLIHEDLFFVCNLMQLLILSNLLNFKIMYYIKYFTFVLQNITYFRNMALLLNTFTVN